MAKTISNNTASLLGPPKYDPTVQQHDPTGLEPFDQNLFEVISNKLSPEQIKAWGSDAYNTVSNFAKEITENYEFGQGINPKARKKYLPALNAIFDISEGYSLNPRTKEVQQKIERDLNIKVDTPEWKALGLSFKSTTGVQQETEYVEDRTKVPSRLWKASFSRNMSKRSPNSRLNEHLGDVISRKVKQFTTYPAQSMLFGIERGEDPTGIADALTKGTWGVPGDYAHVIKYLAQAPAYVGVPVSFVKDLKGHVLNWYTYSGFPRTEQSVIAGDKRLAWMESAWKEIDGNNTTKDVADWYQSISKNLGLPKEKDNVFYSALATLGYVGAPWGAFKSVYVGGKLIQRNIQRAALITKALKEAGTSEHTLKILAGKRFRLEPREDVVSEWHSKMLFGSGPFPTSHPWTSTTSVKLSPKQTWADIRPGRGTIQFEVENVLLSRDRIKQYTDLGWSEKKARRYVRGNAIAFSAGIGSATAHSLGEIFFGEDSAAPTLFGIAGALIHSPITGTFGVLGRLGSSVTVIGGHLVKQGYHKVKIPKLLEFVTGKVTPPPVAFKIWRDSENPLALTKLRSNYLSALGWKINPFDSDVRRMHNAALDMGNDALRNLHKYEKDMAKAQKLGDTVHYEKFKREHELLLAQHLKERTLIREDGTDELIVNAWSQAEKYARMDAKETEFIVKFIKSIEKSEDAKSRLKILSDLQTSFKVRDALALKYKDMDKYDLLLGNAMQSAALQEMRHVLIQKTHMSFIGGQFIRGGLLKELDTMDRVIDKNNTLLKKVLEEIGRGKLDDAPREVHKAMELARSVLGQTLVPDTRKSLELMRKWSRTEMGQYTNQVARRKEQLAKYLGANKNPDDIREEGEAIEKLFWGKATRDADGNITEGADGILETAIRVTNAKYESVKDAHDIRINIGSLFSDLTKSDSIPPSIRQISRTAALTDSQVIALEKDMLESALNLGSVVTIDKKADLIYNRMYGPYVHDTLTPDLQQTIGQRLHNQIYGQGADKDSQQNALDYMMDALAKSDHRDLPRELSIGSFITLRSSLWRKAARAFRSGEMTHYREIVTRINAMDDRLYGQSPEASTSLKAANKFYQDNMLPFRKADSPLGVITKAHEGVTVGVAPENIMISYILFNNPKKSKEAFDSTFKKEGTYDPEAVKYLLSGLGRLLDPDANANTEKILGFLTHFRPVLDSASKNSKFYTDGQSGAGASLTDDLTSFLSFSGKTTKEQVRLNDEVNSILFKAVDSLAQQTDNILVNSSLWKFSSPNLSDTQTTGLLGSNVNSSLKSVTMDDILDDVERGISGQPIGFTRGQEGVSGGEARFRTAVEQAGKGRLQTELALDRVEEMEGNLAGLLRPLDETVETQPTILKTILDEIAALSGGKTSREYQIVKEALKTSLLARMRQRAFPVSKRLGTTETEDAFPSGSATWARTKQALDDAHHLKAYKDSGQTWRDLITSREPDVIDHLRKLNIYKIERKTLAGSLTPSEWDLGVGSNKGFYFDLSHELDIKAFREFFTLYRGALDEVLTPEHIQDLGDLFQLGALGAGRMEGVNLSNIASPFTTAMWLGRIYNAMKGVVSVRYILMEASIADWRRGQQELMQHLLSNEKYARITKQLFLTDVTSPILRRQWWEATMGVLAGLGGRVLTEQEQEKAFTSFNEAQDAIHAANV